MADNKSDWTEKEAEAVAKEPDPIKALNTTLTPPEVDIEKPPGVDVPPRTGPVNEVVPIRELDEPPSDDRNNPDEPGARSGGDAGRGANP